MTNFPNPTPEDTAFQDTGFSLDDAVQIRLWDLAVQCQRLLERGEIDIVKLLQAEGEALAISYERKEPFVVTHFFQK